MGILIQTDGYIEINLFIQQYDLPVMS